MKTIILALGDVTKLNNQVSFDFSLPPASEGNTLPGTLILLGASKEDNVVCWLVSEEQTVVVLWMNFELLRDFFMLQTMGPSNAVLQSQPKVFPACFSSTDLPFSSFSPVQLYSFTHKKFPHWSFRWGTILQCSSSIVFIWALSHTAPGCGKPWRWFLITHSYIPFLLTWSSLSY